MEHSSHAHNQLISFLKLDAISKVEEVGGGGSLEDGKEETIIIYSECFILLSGT